MFCSKCGFQLPEDAVHCSNCGEEVKKTNRSATGGSQAEKRPEGFFSWMPEKIGGFSNPFYHVLTKDEAIKTSDQINFIGLFLALLGFLACFLPAWSVNVLNLKESEMLISGKGGVWLTVLFTLGVAVLYFLKFNNLANAIGAVNFFYALYLFIHIQSVISHYDELSWGVDIKTGPGMWLYLITAIGLVFAPFLWEKFGSKTLK